MNKNKFDYKIFLEKKFFKRTFESIKNHNLFDHLDLTDNEIILHRNIFLDALQTEHLCNSKLKRCCNLKTHYRFYRDENHIRKPLVCEPIQCLKKLSFSKLDPDQKQQIFENNITYYSGNHTSNYLDFFDNYEFFLPKSPITNGSNEDSNLYQEFFWFANKIIEKQKNLFLNTDSRSVFSIQKFVDAVTAILIQEYKQQILVVDALNLKKICTINSFPFSSEKNYSNVYSHLANAPIVIIVDFHNNSIVENNSFELIFNFIKNRFLNKFNTIIIANETWYNIFEKINNFHQKSNFKVKKYTFEELKLINDFFIKAFIMRKNFKN